MLSCIVGKTEVNTFEYDKCKLKEWSNKGLLKCPVCKEQLQYCNGDFKIAYFRHLKNSNCIGNKFNEPETEEHIFGKKIIYNWLKNKKDITNLKLEGWIEETKQRPDIYFEHKDKRYVIEYQCSPISTEYNKRHELYKLANINDIWILGTSKYNFNIYNNEKTFKTIEIEIYNNKNNVLYLKDGTFYRLFNFYNIFKYIEYDLQKMYKTKFIYNMDEIEIDKMLVDDMINFNDVNNTWSLRYNKIKNVTDYINNINREILKKSVLWLGMYKNDYVICSSHDPYESIYNNKVECTLNKNFEFDKKEFKNKMTSYKKLECIKNDIKEIENYINTYLKNEYSKKYSISINVDWDSVWISLCFDYATVFREIMKCDQDISAEVIKNYIFEKFNAYYSNINFSNRKNILEYTNNINNNLKNTIRYKNTTIEEKERYVLLKINGNMIFSIYNNYMVLNEFKKYYEEKEKMYFNDYKSFQNIICKILRCEIYKNY